ncbi:MAG: LacI family DNA-binding transcriptional regulator [Anaerolineales bacterium]|nr:LacI family DNA-binding transcriptional regulator [Anaerolineales bacterium]
MVSIIDVAKKANVSITTVSRVLNGSPHPVSEETRARVLEAAEALNFSPSALAQAMVTRATRIIGVIIGDAMDPYFATIVRGVEDVARRHGYLVIVCNSDRVPEIELQYLHTLDSYRVDGVIFAGGGLTDDKYGRQVGQALEAFYNRGAVCVSLAKHLFSSFSVLVDNEQVVKDAVHYLISLGHRSIAYISGPALLTTTQLRLSGYKSALEAHGLPLKPELIIDGDYKYESGRRAAEAIMALPAKPTAVLASNDLMGIGCLVGLREAGCHVPQDISLMGIDDIATAQAVDPPLTTMALPLYDLGSIGMESLIKLRSHELADHEALTLAHRLIIRRSTAALGTEEAMKR